MGIVRNREENARSRNAEGSVDAVLSVEGSNTEAAPGSDLKENARNQIGENPSKLPCRQHHMYATPSEWLFSNVQLLMFVEGSL